MRIGIDIDGVLNSQYNFCIDYGTKFCNKLGKYRLENINAIDTTDMFLWGEDIAHKFWNTYREDLVVKLPTKKYASEVINKLKDEGNLIYIITARKNNDEWFPDSLKEDVEGITKKWLKENEIYYDVFLDLINMGYKVVLAHPERYISFQKDFNKVYELKEIGVLFQCNVGSILGDYGSQNAADII